MTTALLRIVFSLVSQLEKRVIKVEFNITDISIIVKYSKHILTVFFRYWFLFLGVAGWSPSARLQ